MPTYSPATDEIKKSVSKALSDNHQRLVKYKLRVDILVAHPKTDENGDPIEDALKLHGVPSLATIKIQGPKERALGRGDVLLTLDGYRWDEFTAARQQAILDHELTRLDFKLDKKGEVAFDHYMRPLLKMRPHDHEFGWFDEVVRRHQADAVEVEQLKGFLTGSGQQWFSFMEGFSLKAPKPPPAKKEKPPADNKKAA